MTAGSRHLKRPANVQPGARWCSGCCKNDREAQTPKSPADLAHSASLGADGVPGPRAATGDQMRPCQLHSLGANG